MKMLNQFKTVVLLGLLTTGLVAIGAMFGPTWTVAAAVVAIALNFGGYYFSDRIVLKMHGAVEADPKLHPGLHAMTEEVARIAGIPAPRIYIIPASYPNAFATGRNPQHGVVAVTEGLCQLLSDRELRGVIAHEIAHIRNRDVLIATVASMLAAAITSVANLLQFSAIFGSSDEEDAPSPMAAMAFALIAPIGAGLVQMAISRAREYEADSDAAAFTGDPLALASALQKLSSASQHVYEEPSPATASLFIVNPLHGGIASWFSTHPPIEERIQLLVAMRHHFGQKSDPSGMQTRPLLVRHATGQSLQIFSKSGGKFRIER